MSDRLKELREKRARIVTDMRAITEKVTTEKRAMTGDESTQHDKLYTEQEAASNEIRALERQAELDRQQATEDEVRQRQQQQQQQQQRTDLPNGETRTAMQQLGIEYPKGWSADQDQRAMKGFRSALLTGAANGDGAAEFRKLQEFRAGLQGSSDVDGGNLVAPMEFVAQLLRNVDNAVFIRQKATKRRITASASLGVPTLDSDIDDADWTSELATGGEDTGMKFGKRELSPRPLAKRIKVSKRLIRISAIDPVALVQERMSYKFGVTQEKAFLLGSGANQPLGLMVASNDGIPTTRDFSTGNTTSSPTFDGLMEAKYGVKAAYWSKAEWIFHRDAIKKIMQLKDQNDQYLWQPSVQAGQPDKILNSPVNVSEYMSNTFTTGLYVGIFGDFSQYWIVDALDLQIQGLKELYAETNQDGFIGRMESDGMPVLAEAFARVKLA